MNAPLTRRLARIERATRPEPPWHLPPTGWPDEVLLGVAAPGRATITDAELRAIAEGERLAE